MVRRIYRQIASLFKRTAVIAGPRMNYSVKLNNRLIRNTRISESTAIVGEENLKLSENVFIGHFNFIEASNGIEIGEGCQITNYISILSHSSHNSIRYYGKHYRTSGPDLKGYIKGTVFIGKYTFIGPHVTIMPNTSIGKGSIVSAFSLVKGDFPDFSIIAGNPAVVIGTTKEKDEDFFNNHPELRANYEEWVKE